MGARSRSVLFLAPEPLRPSPTGPARRALKLAEVVGEHCAVTLAAPAPSAFPDGPFQTLETGPADDQSLARAFAAHDVVVVQALPSPRQLLTAARRARRLVVDLIAPLALEALEIGGAGPARDAVVRWRALEMVAHLKAADLVLCTNDRQRDLLVGAGLAGGVADLHRRIAVVPHGLDPVEPVRGRSALRTGTLAGEGLRVAIWAGGMWSWLDPLTAIRAVERLRERRPDLRLAFVGFEHPDPAQRRAHAHVAAAATGYVREHGLEDAVAFRPPWLGRGEYVDHLADADVGVSLHHATPEGRYASRTRILDYLEAALPVLAAEGDTMSEVVERHGLGRVVAPGDVDGCAAALDALTGAAAARPTFGGTLEPLLWRNVARPLLAFCQEPGAAARPSALTALADTARQYPPFARAVLQADGGGGLARAAARRATRALGRG